MGITKNIEKLIYEKRVLHKRKKEKNIPDRREELREKDKCKQKQKKL